MITDHKRFGKHKIMRLHTLLTRASQFYDITDRPTKQAIVSRSMQLKHPLTSSHAGTKLERKKYNHEPELNYLISHVFMS